MIVMWHSYLVPPKIFFASSKFFTKNPLYILYFYGGSSPGSSMMECNQSVYNITLYIQEYTSPPALCIVSRNRQSLQLAAPPFPSLHASNPSTWAPKNPFENAQTIPSNSSFATQTPHSPPGPLSFLHTPPVPP